ncbi:hypothetical protein GCM10020254_13400 [Streptomyces goshikiensis]
MFGMSRSQVSRKTALAAAFGVTAAGAALWAGIGAAQPAHAAGLPAPDHVVVVVFENHAYNQVIGSSSAPYLNSLKTGEPTSPTPSASPTPASRTTSSSSPAPTRA